MKKIAKLTAATLLVSSSVAFAGTADSNLSSTSEVQASCTITTTAVAFGVYNPIVANKDTALDGSGAVNVTCTNGSTVGITLSDGTNVATGGTVSEPARRLLNANVAGNYLSYQLYTATARTTVWGGATSVSSTGTGSAVAVAVFGRIPAGQTTARVGSFSDVVVATVTF